MLWMACWRRDRRPYAMENCFMAFCFYQFLLISYFGFFLSFFFFEQKENEDTSLFRVAADVSPDRMAMHELKKNVVGLFQKFCKERDVFPFGSPPSATDSDTNINIYNATSFCLCLYRIKLKLTISQLNGP